MSGNSWEVDSYRQGKWKVSVRKNLENDRLDEGDYPEGQFYTQRIPGNDDRYNVFRDNLLIAEVRGREVETRTIIPMRELSQEDESKFYNFLDYLATKE